MWWATVTLTTVGYGDVVPMTVAERLLGVFITVLGAGLAADDARQLLKKAALDSMATPVHEGIVCPHCGKPIN